MNEKWVIRDVMATPAHTVTGDAGFKEIVSQLGAHGVSALPVIEEDGRLIGIVSEADLMLKEEYAGQETPGGPFRLPLHRREHLKAAGLRARDLMTTPVVTTTTDTTLPDAANLMRKKRVKRLVVVDGDGCVEGIVSRVDVLKVFLRTDDVIRREVRNVVRDLLWLEEADLRLQVKDGVVTLNGGVPRRSDADILFKVVRRLGGVVAVEGEVTYAEDDTRSLSDARDFWFAPLGAQGSGL
jgi:CBS domain-containing protein